MSATQAGPVQIQGCAIRVTQLDSTGAPIAGATDMWADNVPFVKLACKPEYLAGVDITPVNACGQPTISYKDYDREKRRNVTLTVAALDFERDQLIAGDALLTRGSSAGRAVSDGVTTLNSNVIMSATAAFVNTDVNRTVTGTGIPAATEITAVISSTSARISNPATATATGVSLTFGTVAANTIGAQAVPLLTVGNPNGVSIEVWSKAIQRLTGFQGDTPYPYGGTDLNQSAAYVRTLLPRVYLFVQDLDVDDKEQEQMWQGWAIQNTNWGTGPENDWTTGGVANPGTGVALSSTQVMQKMMDNGLPSPLQPGYQTSLV